jgi:hypothetical protein
VPGVLAGLLAGGLPCEGTRKGGGGHLGMVHLQCTVKLVTDHALPCFIGGPWPRESPYGIINAAQEGAASEVADDSSI